VWTLQDAKNHFSAVVEAAMAGEPQRVTRRGKPAVVVVAEEQFARLEAGAANPLRSFEDNLLLFPSSPAGDRDFVIEPLPFRMRDVEF
jgi:antitoxin Phd